MRHFVIVCLLLLIGLGGATLRSEGSIRIVGGLGELTSKTVRGHGVEITQDGAVITIDASQREIFVKALCESHKNLAREQNIILLNLANSSTTKTASGEPYRRQITSYDANGRFKEITEDQSDFNWIYDPTHPDAMRDGPRSGYVAKPNVNTEAEFQDLYRSRIEQSSIQTILGRLDPELIILDQPQYQFPVKPKYDKKFSSSKARNLQQPKEHLEVSQGAEFSRPQISDADPYAYIGRPIGHNGLL